MEALVRDCFRGVFRGRKVLVTGNTGFKGSWLSLWLSALGAEVSGVAKDVPTTPALYETLRLMDRVQQHWCDVRDFSAFSSVVQLEEPEFVFHLAAQPVVARSYEDPLETFSTNAMGTAHVLEALRNLKAPCCAVLITSDKCYANEEWTWGYRENDRLGGKDPYSASKACAENIAHAYVHSFLGQEGDLRLATARAGNVIGGGDWTPHRIIPDCVRSWGQRQPVVLRSPGATRPWQHVLEPLSGYLRLAQRLREGTVQQGESFNFGPRAEQNATVLKVVQDMGKAMGFDSLYRVDGVVSFSEAGLLKLSCDKALAQLEWRAALDYGQTLSFTADWYRAYLDGSRDLCGFTLEQIDSYENLARGEAIPWAMD